MDQRYVFQNVKNIKIPADQLITESRRVSRAQRRRENVYCCFYKRKPTAFDPPYWWRLRSKIVPDQISRLSVRDCSDSVWQLQLGFPLGQACLNPCYSPSLSGFCKAQVICSLPGLLYCFWFTPFAGGGAVFGLPLGLSHHNNPPSRIRESI